MRRLANFLTIVTLALIVGCNSESFVASDDGSSDSGVAALTLIASNTQLGSSSSESIDLTAIATDANNVVVEGVDVAFATTSGSVTVSQKTTDSNGQALAELSPGTDPTNRTITVSASVGTVSTSSTISINGSQISISGSQSIASNATTTLTITLRDSANNVAPNQSVTIASSNGNGLSATSGTSNSNGQVQVVVTGSASGTDTITVTALGTIATHTITVDASSFSVSADAEAEINTCSEVTATWVSNGTPQASKTIAFAITRGNIYASNDPTCAGSTVTSATTDGSGVATVYIMESGAGTGTITATATNGPSASASIEFVATTPATLILQKESATVDTGDSVSLTATVRDSVGNLVKNQSITFKILQDNTGGNISPGVGTTNSAGQATTVYSASSTPSATNGVIIEARVTGTAIADQVSLTVAQEALFISLGLANKIEEETSASYALPGVVHIVDAGGAKVTDQKVTLTLTPLYYGKGYREWSLTDEAWIAISTIADTGAPTPSASPYAAQVDLTVGVGGEVCRNEDMLSANADYYLNGILDSGEDHNGNGQIDSGNIATVDKSVTTNSNGYSEFYVRYPKDFADWVYVELTATAGVAGSESSRSVRFWLIAAASDVTDEATAPPGDPSPFGYGTVCSDPD